MEVTGVLANRAVLVRSVISQTLVCNVYVGQITLPIYNKFHLSLAHFIKKEKPNFIIWLISPIILLQKQLDQR